MKRGTAREPTENVSGHAVYASSDWILFSAWPALQGS